MKLKQAILEKQPGAWAQWADHLRRKGKTYNEVFLSICGIFAKEGKPLPSLDDFEEEMQEADRVASFSTTPIPGPEYGL